MYFPCLVSGNDSDRADIVKELLVMVTLLIFHISQSVKEVFNFVSVESNPLVQWSHPFLLPAMLRELDVPNFLDCL